MHAFSELPGSDVLDGLLKMPKPVPLRPTEAQGGAGKAGEEGLGSAARSVSHLRARTVTLDAMALDPGLVRALNHLERVRAVLRPLLKRECVERLALWSKGKFEIASAPITGARERHATSCSGWDGPQALCTRAAIHAAH